MPSTRNQSAVKRTKALNASIKPYDTPQKARFRQAIYDFELNSPSNITRCKKDIFDRFQIPERSARRILAEECDRTASYQAGRKELRGQRPKLSSEDVQACESIITKYGYQGRSLTWDQLAFELNLDVSG